MEMSPSERRQYWESILTQWEESGQTIAGFCAANNIAVHCFYYWKKKFADDRLPVEGFKELTSPPTDGAGLWFDFGNGAKLVIDNEFNQHTFKKLMGVLSGC